MNKLKFLSIVIAAVFQANNSYAASFACEKATTNVEKIICSDANIGKFDDALAENYKMMKMANIGDAARKELIATQKEWIAKRNACTDKICIEKLYRQRVEAVCDYPVLSGSHPNCIDVNETASDSGSRASTNTSTHSQPVRGQTKNDGANLELFCSGVLSRASGLIDQNMGKFSGDAKSTMLQLREHLKNNSSSLMAKGIQLGGNPESVNSGIFYANSKIGNNVMIILQKGTEQNTVVMDCLRKN